MAGAGLFTVGILLAVGVLGLVFGLLGFVLRALGVLAGRGQLAPHQLNSRRAAGAAFVGVLCIYVLETGGWPLDQLPPWVPSTLMAAAGVALLLVLAGVMGARERDPSGVVVSLVIAGGGYALLQWQCYVPSAYFGADYLPAELINRFLPGVYIALVAAGLARALVCVQSFGNQQQRHPYEIARTRAVGAAFVLIAALYVLDTGQWLGSLFGALAAWVPTALLAVAGLSLLVLVSGLHAAHKSGMRDPHGVGISLVIAAAAVVALWGGWQMPAGPAAEFANRLLPGIYLAVLVAALVRALICTHLLGGAWRIIERARRRRAMRPRAASSGSGFWAEMRESFRRGRAGRAWLD